MKITKQMLRDHGYSKECEGCRYQRAGMREQRVHSEECRARLMREMGETEDGRQRLENQNDRMNNWLAEGTQEEDATMIDDGGEVGVQDSSKPQQDDDMMQSHVEDAAAEEQESVLSSSMRRISRGHSSGQQDEGTHKERMRGEKARMEEDLGIDVVEIFSPPRVTLGG